MKDFFSVWIKAFRLRTLPLASASIILGIFLSVFYQSFRPIVSLFALITALLLQILSNLANDFGDADTGVDNSERIGPQRTVQSGLIHQSSMKKAIILFSVLSLISGILLILISFDFKISFFVLLFFIIGLASIAAALKYTMGKNPYGYSGMGDLFVFLFFGLAGTLGTFFLNTHFLEWDILLPASAIGLLSSGVLNLNNMRDVVNDKKNNKKTLIVIFGEDFGKRYHIILLVFPYLLLIHFTVLNFFSYWQYLFLLTIPLTIINLKSVFLTGKQLDPFLKRLALTSLAIVFMFGLGILLSL